MHACLLMTRPKVPIVSTYVTQLSGSIQTKNFQGFVMEQKIRVKKCAHFNRRIVLFQNRAKKTV